jgi:alpha-N-arabinofuranosidase
VATQSARISVGSSVGPLDRRVFGSFVEHLGRSVYGGIYEPGHPTADSDGFRRDVLDLVSELGVTTVRYPGGNFVSGYRWEDGVGPRDARPRRLDLAWHSTETNEIGLHEFASWAERAGCEPMLALNLGTRGVQEALDLLEYSNRAAGTALADLRAANGAAEPFDIRMWCLGNEMDGPWQLGHRDADDYGTLAAQTARAMRQFDPGLELVVCGSSGIGMPTFGSWERTVLDHTYEEVDFISCHAYYQERAGDLASFLASAVEMDSFVETVAAIIDEVKERKGSDHTVAISFDEWNVWDAERFNAVEKITDPAHWPVAPRLLEDVYSVADAVVVGSLLISLLKHADRVRAASLAQLVNVIAPIMTEPGGSAWRQTIFHPFAITSRLARGSVVQLEVASPAVETATHGVVPAVDAVATISPVDGGVSVFLVNRSTVADVAVTIDLAPLGVDRLVGSYLLHDADPRATNTAREPDRVTPRPHPDAQLQGGTLTATVPAVSWTAFAFSTAVLLS